jgi:hypothetical protein
VEKAAKGKQLPTDEQMQQVQPNRRPPMHSQKIIAQARAKTGLGRGVNNMMNPATRQSPYGNMQ